MELYMSVRFHLHEVVSVPVSILVILPPGNPFRSAQRMCILRLHSTTRTPNCNQNMKMTRRHCCISLTLILRSKNHSSSFLCLLISRHLNGKIHPSVNIVSASALVLSKICKQTYPSSSQPWERCVCGYSTIHSSRKSHQRSKRLRRPATPRSAFSDGPWEKWPKNQHL